MSKEDLATKLVELSAKLLLELKEEGMSSDDALGTLCSIPYFTCLLALENHPKPLRIGMVQAVRQASEQAYHVNLSNLLDGEYEKHS